MRRPLKSRWLHLAGKRRLHRPSIAFFWLATWLVARHAAASNERGPCHGPRIVTAPALALRWRDAAEGARARLSGKANLDLCAELLLDPDGDNLHIRVWLADGRGTERELSDPLALYDTLNALLSLPPIEPDTEPRELTTDAPERPVDNPNVPPLRPHLELGLGGMGRVAGAPLYGAAGLAAFAQLNLDRWVVGVSARWDALDALVSAAPPSGFNMQTLALGIDFGVRSLLHSATLDVLIGPEVRIENQEAFGGETAPDGIGGGTSDVRLDASLRIATPRSSPARFFSQWDVDVSPARSAKARRLDPGLPTLPAWSAGLALGVAWSLP